MKDIYVEEQREKEEKQKELEIIERQKMEEREERLAKMTEEKRKLLKNISEDTPVDDMPDCLMKYEKIVKQFRETSQRF